MRINLHCPYAEKDSAKQLGAKWDPAAKTWYIVNVEDLTPFMRWIPAKQHTHPGKKKRPKRPKQTPEDRHKPKVTGQYTPLCNCTTPPWEHCPHTEQQAQKAMESML